MPPMTEPRSLAESAGAPSRVDLVVAELRDEILRGRFRSGERLPSERDLALRFAVHRGAVREALKKLEQLGLAEIRPGGARVRPLEEASLDVVEHLIDLEDPPNPLLVGQVLEVFCGLFEVAARLGVERADESQSARAIEILESLENPELELDAQHEAMLELGSLFVDASGNPVLQLVRRGLKTTQILDRLRARADAPKQLPVAHEWLKRVREAVAARDGARAAEAVHQLARVFREFSVETLEQLRADATPSTESGVAR